MDIQQLIDQRTRALNAFHDHIADHLRCDCSLGKLTAGPGCNQGAQLEDDVVRAWVAVEDAKLAAGVN